MTPILPLKHYYVYVLVRPNGKVFYVGKGTGSRMHAHEKESRSGCTCHKCAVIRKVWRTGGSITKTIVFTSDSEQEAYDHEAGLINQIGLSNLTNQIPGGGKGRYILPNKPLTELTDNEYIRYLQQQKYSRREIERMVRSLRVRKLEELERQWRMFRQRWQNDEAARLIPQIEQLRILLGMTAQQELGL